MRYERSAEAIKAEYDAILAERGLVGKDMSPDAVRTLMAEAAQRVILQMGRAFARLGS